MTNVTGDDVVISAFVEDELLEPINEGIVDVLKISAENLGIYPNLKQSEDAGEGFHMLKPVSDLTGIQTLLF